MRDLVFFYLVALRALNVVSAKRPKLSIFQKIENMNLALNAAKSIGCVVTNVNAKVRVLPEESDPAPINPCHKYTECSIDYVLLKVKGYNAIPTGWYDISGVPFRSRHALMGGDIRSSHLGGVPVPFCPIQCRPSPPQYSAFDSNVPFFV